MARICGIQPCTILKLKNTACAAFTSRNPEWGTSHRLSTSLKPKSITGNEHSSIVWGPEDCTSSTKVQSLDKKKSNGEVLTERSSREDKSSPPIPIREASIKGDLIVQKKQDNQVQKPRKLGDEGLHANIVQKPRKLGDILQANIVQKPKKLDEILQASMVQKRGKQEGIPEGKGWGIMGSKGKDEMRWSNANDLNNNMESRKGRDEDRMKGKHWVPHPLTGVWMPEDQIDSVDPVQLRQHLLPQVEGPEVRN